MSRKRAAADASASAPPPKRARKAAAAAAEPNPFFEFNDAPKLLLPWIRGQEDFWTETALACVKKLFAAACQEGGHVARTLFKEDQAMIRATSVSNHHLTWTVFLPALSGHRSPNTIARWKRIASAGPLNNGFTAACTDQGALQRWNFVYAFLQILGIQTHDLCSTLPRLEKGSAALAAAQRRLRKLEETRAVAVQQALTASRSLSDTIAVQSLLLRLMLTWPDFGEDSMGTIRRMSLWHDFYTKMHLYMRSPAIAQRLLLHMPEQALRVATDLPVEQRPIALIRDLVHRWVVEFTQEQRAALVENGSRHVSHALQHLVDTRDWAMLRVTLEAFVPWVVVINMPQAIAEEGLSAAEEEQLEQLWTHPGIQHGSDVADIYLPLLQAGRYERVNQLYTLYRKSEPDGYSHGTLEECALSFIPVDEPEALTRILPFLTDLAPIRVVQSLRDPQQLMLYLAARDPAEPKVGISPQTLLTVMWNYIQRMFVRDEVYGVSLDGERPRVVDWLHSPPPIRVLRTAWWPLYEDVFAEEGVAEDAESRTWALIFMWLCLFRLPYDPAHADEFREMAERVLVGLDRCAAPLEKIIRAANHDVLHYRIRYQYEGIPFHFLQALGRQPAYFRDVLFPFMSEKLYTLLRVQEPSRDTVPDLLYLAAHPEVDAPWARLCARCRALIKARAVYVKQTRLFWAPHVPETVVQRYLTVSGDCPLHQ